MSFEIIEALIGSVGFPIVAFIICAYFLKYTYDKSMEQTSEITNQITQLAEAVNNNTQVLTQLVEKVDKKK